MKNFYYQKLKYCIKYVPKLKWYNKRPYVYPKTENESLLISYFSNGTKSYVWGTPGKAFEKKFLMKV